MVAGRVEALAWFVIQTRSVAGLVFHVVWESFGGGALLAACKTLAFRKKQPGQRAQSRDAAVVLQLSLVVVCAVNDGLWRMERRPSTALPARARMATE